MQDGFTKYGIGIAIRYTTLLVVADGVSAKRMIWPQLLDWYPAVGDSVIGLWRRLGSLFSIGISTSFKGL